MVCAPLRDSEKAVEVLFVAVFSAIPQQASSGGHIACSLRLDINSMGIGDGAWLELPQARGASASKRARRARNSEVFQFRENFERVT